MESTASQSQREIFSDERTELIDFDEGADLSLWWACRGASAAWTNQRETVLWWIPRTRPILASPSLQDRADRPVV